MTILANEPLLVLTRTEYERDMAAARLEGSLDSGPQGEYLRELESAVRLSVHTAIQSGDFRTPFRLLTESLWDSMSRRGRA